MDRTTWLFFGIVAILVILAILALRKMPPSRDALILLLAVAAASAAGFLWIEYTIPGVWPPWIGLPAEGHH